MCACASFVFRVHSEVLSACVFWMRSLSGPSCDDDIVQIPYRNVWCCFFCACFRLINECFFSLCYLHQVSLWSGRDRCPPFAASTSNHIWRTCVSVWEFLRFAHFARITVTGNSTAKYTQTHQRVDFHFSPQQYVYVLCEFIYSIHYITCG